MLFVFLVVITLVALEVVLRLLVFGCVISLIFVSCMTCILNIINSISIINVMCVTGIICIMSGITIIGTTSKEGRRGACLGALEAPQHCPTPKAENTVNAPVSGYLGY